MKLIKRCFIILLIATLIPTSCLAIPSDLWVDDGSLDKIYGTDKVIISDVVSTESDLLSELLYRISVLPEYEYEFSKNADYNVYLQAIASISGFAGSETAFEDLKSAGMINISRPAENVIYDDALYTAVNLTGYEFDAEFNGGQPHNYYITAKSNNLLYNLSYRANQPMTNGEMIQLLYNIISVRVNKVKNFGEYIQFEKGKSILESRFDTVLLKGVVTGAAYTSLYPAQSLLKNQIAIDQVIYKTDINDISEYIGMCVNAFVTTREDGEYIILARPDSKSNSVIDIKSEKILNSGEKFVEYDNGEDIERIDISRNARMIYNGKYSGNATGDAIETYCNDDASVKLIDNDGDGETDAIIIWQFEHYVVKFDVGSSNRVQLKYGMKYRESSYLILDESKSDIEIFFGNNTVSAAEIKSGMVISVAQSANTVGKTYMRIELSDMKVNGKVDAVDYDGSTPLIFMNNMSYKMAKGYSDMGGNALNQKVNDEIVAVEPGESYELLLTFDNKIADASANKKSGKLGCLLSWGKDRGLDAALKLKIFDEEGSMKTYTLADRVTIYNSSYLDGKIVSKEKAEELLPPQNIEDPRVMVQFSANGEDKINEIYLAVDNMENGPGTLNYPVSKDFFLSGDIYYYQEMFETRYRTFSDMKVFYIPAPENRKNEKEYSVVNVNAYGNQHYYSNMTLYSVDDYLIPGFGVCQSEGSGSDIFSASASAVVDKLVDAVDSEGMPTVKIYYYINGNRSSVMVADAEAVSSIQDSWYNNVKVTDLKRGDVFQFETNAEGQLARFRVIYRPDNSGNYRIQSDTGAELTELDQPYGFGLFYGEAIGIKEDVLMFDFNRDDMNNQPQRVLSGTFCYLIENDRITVSSLGEILPGDKLAVRIGWPGAMEIYIYR